jgi:dGTPase
VAQIARTAARALFLNEDLTEAIALGHDLGHTPFGHAGEAVLNEVYAAGFRHYEQSLRIVEKLDQSAAGPGLNLTYEVRDGILNHSKGKSILMGKPLESACTREGDLVSVCDALAYINHDIDDAMRARLITLDDLPQDALQVLGHTYSERINSMVVGLIQGSGDRRIDLLPEIREATAVLRSFLYAHVYPSPPIASEIAKAKDLMRQLYFHLIEHPTPESSAGDLEEPLERRTVDFIAGMTDPYALQLYQRLFFPSAWPA